jgi:hypothetical protein
VISSSKISILEESKRYFQDVYVNICLRVVRGGLVYAESG